jgi:hypothetical protein
MNIRNKIRLALREQYGEFNTNLEHEYENTLTEKLILGGIEDQGLGTTYNQVILELKNSLKNTLKLASYNIC